MKAMRTSITDLRQQGDSETPGQGQSTLVAGSESAQESCSSAGDRNGKESSAQGSAEAKIQNLDLVDIDRRLRKLINGRPWAALGITFIVGAFAGYRIWKR